MNTPNRVVERLTMPVMKRYVRRLLSDSDRQYREWLERNDPARTALRSLTEQKP